MSRTTSSRRKALNFAAAASIVVASFAAQSADARAFGGFGGGGFARMGGIGRVGGLGGGMGGGRVFGGHFASFTGHGGRIGPIILPPHPVIPGPPPGHHPPFPIPLPIPVHLPPPIPGGHPPIPLPIPIHLPPGPIPNPNPGPGPGPGNPGGPPDHDHHHHHHHHWVFIGGAWVVIDDVTNEVVPADPDDGLAPGPCTCLTKTYTPSGLVVFADVCTKESASASAYGNASAEATQVPTTPVAATAVPMSVVPTSPDYAGRTYEDYLAANPQLAQPQAAAPQATQN
jgi:hypothetical protein